MRLKFFIDPSSQGPGVGRDGLEGSGASRAGGKTSGQRDLEPAKPQNGSHDRPSQAVRSRLGGDAADGREEELQAIQGGPGE